MTRRSLVPASSSDLTTRLKDFMARTGFTQDKIASCADVSQSVVSRLVKSGKVPRPENRERLEAFLSVGPPEPLTRMETFAALAVSLLPGSSTTSFLPSESTPQRIAKFPDWTRSTFKSLLKQASLKLRASDSFDVMKKVYEELRKESSEILHGGALEEVVRQYLEAQSTALYGRLQDKMKKGLASRYLLFELAMAALPVTREHSRDRDIETVRAVRAEWSERFSWWGFCQNEVVLKVRREVRKGFVRFVEELIRELQRGAQVNNDRSPKETAVECIKLVDSIAAELLGNPEAEQDEIQRLRRFIDDLEKPPQTSKTKKGGHTPGSATAGRRSRSTT